MKTLLNLAIVTTISFGALAPVNAQAQAVSQLTQTDARALYMECLKPKNRHALNVQMRQDCVMKCRLFTKAWGGDNPETPSERNIIAADCKSAYESVLGKVYQPRVQNPTPAPIYNGRGN